MGKPKQHTADAVIAAIKGSAGIKTTIGSRLNVHRHTVERYLKNYPKAMLAYQNEVSTVGDLVESVILKAIQQDDVETAKWYAKNKLKDRGYSERIEIREIKEMTDAEIIAAIQSRVGADLFAGPGSGTAEADAAAPTLH